MNKQKLFLDYDGVLVHSIKAYCDTYNYLYQSHKDFKPAIWHKVKRYDLKDECPLCENVWKLFQDEYFFSVLEFMDDNTLETIEKLTKQYKLYLCTIGTPKNLALKSLWVEKNIPYIKNYILLSNGINSMNKSVVNMEGAIFIDDVKSNLDSSNAELKFTFGDVYEWNIGEDYKRCYNWTDIEKLLL